MKWNPRWMAVVAVATASLALARPAAGVLTDMAGHWAAPLVAALEAKGIVSGDNGRFDPDSPLSRAQMARLFVSALGNEADARLLANADSRFTDIPRAHWANGYIESFAESAITEGYPDGRFGPADVVTRAQMAAFLVRALGLSTQARNMAFEPTRFTDDAAIPFWARGSVNAAAALGLMKGYEDGSFRPAEAITRAEGGAAIQRLTSIRGTTYHLTGTLMKFNAATLQGAVRDELGQERAFTMGADAQYFRQGAAVTAAAVRTLDQVWVVLGPDGKGRLLDARYADILGTEVTVSGRTLSLMPTGQPRREFVVQSGALVFLNGRPAALGALDGASQAYLVLDRATGQVRVADAIRISVAGTLVGTMEGGRLTLQTNTGTQSFVITPDAVIMLNGQRLSAADLRPGDRVQAATDAQSALTFLLAER